MKTTKMIGRFTVGEFTLNFLDMGALDRKEREIVKTLPFSIRILLENLIRNSAGGTVREKDVFNLLNWEETAGRAVEIPFWPARILMQDFTGVPAVVDFAAMRSAAQRLGRDPMLINPAVPVDLIIDHSVTLDYAGVWDALDKNMVNEFERNHARYVLLKWAWANFDNFRVIPPGSGICHQINLEHLSEVISVANTDAGFFAFPETVVGCDSHTTMINALGVLGWGVGGVDAEAVMLGQPLYMTIPQVVGVKLSGRLRAGVSATDAALYVTQILRSENVVEKFVEFFGPGVETMPLADRACISNMAPEYGATSGLFPMDRETLNWLKMTGRRNRAELVEKYSKLTGLFYTGREETHYTKVVEIKLDDAEPSVAGPSRPNQRIPMKEVKGKSLRILSDWRKKGGKRSCKFTSGGGQAKLEDGGVVIASITSCTNTSNPGLLIAAGILAEKSLKRGLKVPPHVKTSFAPGSRAAAKYLDAAGLMDPLKALGFHIAAFGCATCIGNGGGLNEGVEKAMIENDIHTVSVISGNRNFEARIHPKVRGNFLASPMLVVAFALAGRIDIDFESEPLSADKTGEPVFLRDILPDEAEVSGILKRLDMERHFMESYDNILLGNESWFRLPVEKSPAFKWDPGSTYIKDPPYFQNFSFETKGPGDIKNARPLVIMGDSVTTDHISPAGVIDRDYPAGQWLRKEWISPGDFNSYGSRRGNHEVMIRGTFGNVRLKNLMIPGEEGGRTIYFPAKKGGAGEVKFVYDAAKAYERDNVPLVILAGKEYGTGSSRDWAAKGTALLGVGCVIAESFERIHRSNLVSMGVLPLEFEAGCSVKSLGIDGSELFSIAGIADMAPQKEMIVELVRKGGEVVKFKARARLDTEIEVAYFEHGGILLYMLRKVFGEGGGD